MDILINYEIAPNFEEATGLSALPLNPYSRLDTPVRSHADMLICVIDRTVFSYSDYIRNNSELFCLLEQRGYDVCECTPPKTPFYPDDISLNVAIVGKKLFCNLKSVATEIKRYAEKNGYSIINVRQGYSACTTLVLDENNVITADASMEKVMRREGICVLRIACDEILLPGYDKGFIGGATAVINKKVYFFGDAKRLKEYTEISERIRSLGMQIISISSGDVVDFGGAKLI